MSKPKFKEGDIVLYQNGNTFELGLVKDILNTNTRTNNNYKYRVYYHMGSTTAVTDECNLHPINNAYAFTIIKKSVEPDIQVSPARQLANKILSQFRFYGQCYYDLEDWLTQIIEGEDPRIPFSVDCEYLICALQIELEDIFNSKGIHFVSDEDIQECVQRLTNHINRNVLDMDFIEDIVDEYIEEQKEIIYFQVVYMYNSDKETEYVEHYTDNEYEDACSDYKYFVEQKDCAYVILQKFQVIYDKEEKYILEEYHSEED